MKTTLNRTTPLIPSRTIWNYTRTRDVLSNGLTAVTVTQPNLHSTAISLFIRCGSRYETANQSGLSHFLEHMLFRGTRNYPTAYSLNVAFEQLGGTLSASTAADATEFSIALPSETTLDGIDLLAEVISNPLFNEIDVEKKIVAEEIREELDEDDNPVDLDYLSRKRLWPAHPLGQNITGSIDTINDIDAAALKDWFARHYVARNMIICVSGAIQGDLVRQRIQMLLGNIAPGTRAKTTRAPMANGQPATLHKKKPGSQTQIRLAFRAPGLLDPDTTAVELLMRLMDDGMSTPVHRRIFEENGLAYNVGADLELYADTGAINMDAICSHENVLPLAQEALSIADDFREGRFDQGELEKARARTLWDLRDYLDSPPAMNAWYGEQEIYQIPRTLKNYASEIEALSMEQIKAAARRIFTRQNLIVTTVGTQSKTQQDGLKNLTTSFPDA